MTRNYMEEVANLLGLELEEEFRMKYPDVGKYKFTSEGLMGNYGGGWLMTVTTMTKLLNGTVEIERCVLIEEEKEYLSAVIKPFKDKILYISKHGCLDTEWLTVYMEEDDLMYFPKFKENTMYTGMVLDKAYTLEELGL